VREQVLHYIRDRELLKAGDRVAVAVSGGADSVALLRVLLELRAELGIVLFVAHVNHQLRGAESDADQRFVAELARECGLEFLSIRGDVREYARQHQQGIEETARELRYKWLDSKAYEHRLTVIATGHTLDDQAETVLMKFLRGAGTRGLAGIYPKLDFGIDVPMPFFSSTFSGVPIVRPLLGVARASIESYLSSLGQDWREDESNLDHRFARNRVRHELLPLLEREYNPNIRVVLSEMAEVARADEEYWQALARGEIAVRTPSRQSLRVDGFAELPLAVRRHVVRGFLANRGCAADFEHVENVLRCALGEIEKTNLPGDWVASRNGNCLLLLNPEEQQARAAAGGSYQHRLMVPGMAHIEQIGLTLQAVVVRGKSLPEHADWGGFLSANLLGPELTIRNWQPGDRFRPAHSGSEEKLKRLFSEKRIPAEQRPLWPVALAGSQIVWVRGFPVAHDYAWVPGSGDAVRIEVLPQE
jgi:tRNA(Ile)-lysidine synthase